MLFLYFPSSFDFQTGGGEWKKQKHKIASPLHDVHTRRKRETRYDRWPARWLDAMRNSLDCGIPPTNKKKKKKNMSLTIFFSALFCTCTHVCVCVLKEGGARATWNQHNGGWGISQTFPSFSFLDIIREGNQIHIATRTNGWMDGWTSTRRSTSIVVDAVDLQRGLHTYKELLIN